jgi:hypothetical protein
MQLRELNQLNQNQSNELLVASLNRQVHQMLKLFRQDLHHLKET